MQRQLAMLPRYNKTLEKLDLRSFVDIMSEQDQAIMIDLMKVLTDTLEESNITHFIEAGTLLGSWRHHDIIPWDDDMDVVVFEKDRHAVMMALEKLQPDYMSVHLGVRFKFYSKKSKKTSYDPWHWPYIDVNIYAENASHLWDSSPISSKPVYPKDHIFPTHKRPLGDLSLYAPKDSFAMLREYFGWSVECRSKYYSHIRGSRINDSVTVPCKILKSVFPFVHRTMSESGIKETLKFNDVTIHSITVSEPVYALTEPYALILQNNTK